LNRATRVAVATLCVFCAGLPSLGGAASPADTSAKSTKAEHGAVDAAVAQAVNGFILGALICEAGNRCRDEETFVSMNAGAVAGAALGYVVGRQFPRGAVITTDTGMLVGALGGVLLGERSIKERRDNNDWGFDDDVVRARYVLTGELIGGLTFAALAYWQEPTAAQASLANTVGFWTTFSLLQFASLRPSAPSNLGLGATFAISYAAGWVLWDDLRPSRLSVWKIDLGAMLGTFVGAVYFGVSDGGSQRSLRPVLVGTLVGAAAGAWFAFDSPQTDTADNDVPPISLAVVPREGGGIIGVRGSF